MTTSTHERIKVFCDGGSRGNPGPAASGVVFTTTKDEVIGEFHEYLGVKTNNVAEYRAVILGLKQLREQGRTGADFYLDSELVTKQINGEYKVKHEDMKPLYTEVMQLAKGLDLTFSHVRREFNKLADAQVNICLDAQSQA